MFIILFLACGLTSYDSQLISEQGPERSGTESDSGWQDTGWEDSGWQDTGTQDTGPDSVPGDSPESARPPRSGEVFIHELMINPSAVADSKGEYTELRNSSSDWLDLHGFALADEDVDFSELLPTGADLVVGPGELLVVCASATGNGGVSCQATIDPKSTGGGFVLANSEDEVLLIDASGATLDAVRYSGDFAPTGAAVGLRPSKQSASANDSAGNWCEQASGLSGGDAGTPGDDNNGC